MTRSSPPTSATASASRQSDVPLPSTPVAGLKALGYYDPPPPGSKTKPKLVGEFPCAVFGTVAADGRTHAHRIYVAPGGAGKADLGSGPDGHAARSEEVGQTQRRRQHRGLFGAVGRSRAGATRTLNRGNRDRRGGGAGLRSRDSGWRYCGRVSHHGRRCRSFPALSRH